MSRVTPPSASRFKFGDAIDHERREQSVASIGKGDSHWTRVEVDDWAGIRRVPLAQATSRL
jgi:hypothetical protein